MRRLRLELGVLVTLLASLLTVPLPLPHVASATAWAVLAAVHMLRRHRIYAALLRSGRHRVRVVATTALIGSAVVATLSGFAQWAGVAAAIPWHAGSSTLLVLLAVAHAASRLWRQWPVAASRFCRSGRSARESLPTINDAITCSRNTACRAAPSMPRSISREKTKGR